MLVSWHIAYVNIIQPVPFRYVVMRLQSGIRRQYRIKHLVETYSKNISFVYFKPLLDETAIYQIRIDESGNFLDRWPDGFFDDRDEDIWS
jgi:predicted ATPase